MTLYDLSFGSEAGWNGATDPTSANRDLDMFLKIFSGEVLAAFEEANVMLPLTKVRNINSGKTAQFPVTGKASATYHKPGTSMFDMTSTNGDYLETIQVGERTIAVDDLLVAPCFIDSLDEAMSHYDYRGPFSAELGRALSYRLDKNLMKIMFLASDDSASGALNAGAGKVQLDSTSDGSGTIADITTAEVVDALFTAAENLDAGDVPEEGRFAIFEPALYYRMIQNAGSAGIVINRDFDGQGSIAEGAVMQVAGFDIYKANHVTDVRGEGNVSAASNGERNTYHGDFREFCGLYGQTEGVGTVKLKDISMETEYIIERQGNLMVAKVACGSNVLRAEACGAFTFDAVA